MQTQPRLEDGPLVLRAWTYDDVPLVREVATDPDIPTNTTLPREAEHDPAAARAYVDRQHGRTTNGEGWSFAIVRDEVAVGMIGLFLRDRPPGRATIGYWLAERHRGEGTATRALRLISSWGLALPGIHRLELYVEPWNEASWRTAEHAGFEREGLLRAWEQIRGEHRDLFMYSRLHT